MLFQQILAGVVTLQRYIQGTCQKQCQYHIGKHVAAVINKRIQMGVVKRAETGEVGGLDDPVDTYRLLLRF